MALGVGVTSEGPISGKRRGGRGASRAGGLGFWAGEAPSWSSSKPSQECLVMLGVVLVLSWSSSNKFEIPIYSKSYYGTSCLRHKYIEFLSWLPNNLPSGLSFFTEVSIPSMAGGKGSCGSL